MLGENISTIGLIQMTFGPDFDAPLTMNNFGDPLTFNLASG